MLHGVLFASPAAVAAAVAGLLEDIATAALLDDDAVDAALLEDAGVCSKRVLLQRVLQLQRAHSSASKQTAAIPLRCGALNGSALLSLLQ